MKTNIKKYLVLTVSILSIATSVYAGWAVNDWIDRRDKALIQEGYDKAIDQINLENK